MKVKVMISTDTSYPVSDILADLEKRLKDVKMRHKLTGWGIEEIRTFMDHPVEKDTMKYRCSHCPSVLTYQKKQLNIIKILA